ncbi:MAG TPA: hypothetical protein PLM79_02745 [Syntrophobacteraceae bacterium]|nr:hypothetical protein [Syntrophobacteraceae bacterium]
MGTIPILSRNQSCGDTNFRECGLFQATLRELPDFYMTDYSVWGLLVDNPREVLQLLDEHGFRVIRKPGAMEVEIDGFTRVHEIVRLFSAAGIAFEMADLVDGVYQG